MSHDTFDIKSSNYSPKPKEGFISVSKLKKGMKLPFVMMDDEGPFEKDVIISKVKILSSGEVQLEFSNYSMYEPFEFRKNDFVLVK
jgi:hypothetical protein